MKTIKLNWGAGIAVSYLGFVAMILVLVVMSTGEKIDLVTTQYYTEELHFQDKINKINRTKALTDPLQWKLENKDLIIRFPESSEPGKLSGTVKLYCPSNDKKDAVFALQSIDGKQTIPLSRVANGRYLLQIDWKNGDLSYWNEGVLNINHSDQN